MIIHQKRSKNFNVVRKLIFKRFIMSLDLLAVYVNTWPAVKKQRNYNN